jgi:uncharacterized protein (DUF1778 family)
VKSAAKSERIEARVSPEQKDLLEYAAALRGQTVGDFMRDSLRQAAEQTIREHEVMRLTARDSRAFVEALLAPPAPNAALRAAAAHYKRVMQP